MIAKIVECELCDETVKVRAANTGGLQDLPEGWVGGTLNLPETKEAMIRKGYDLKAVNVHFCPKCIAKMKL